MAEDWTLANYNSHAAAKLVLVTIIFECLDCAHLVVAASFVVVPAVPAGKLDVVRLVATVPTFIKKGIWQASEAASHDDLYI